MLKAGNISRLALVTGLLIIWSMSASAQDIKYNFLQGTDFSKYKTYKWVQVPGVQYPNSIVDDQIKRAIDSQLSLKGLTTVNFDFVRMYRPETNVVRRPVKGVGHGYSITGHHEIMLPLFAAALKT